MIPKTEEIKEKVTAEEAGKKAFRDAMSKLETQIDAATSEIKKFRANLKTETAEAKAKGVARLDELSKNLDAARKEQQVKIEARLKELRNDIEAVNVELKHATLSGRAALEAKATILREEYETTRSALSATLEAELAEAKARIGVILETAADKKASAKAAVEAKIADLHKKYEAARQKLQNLKKTNASAYGELHRGVQAAINDVQTALQRARAEITSS
jgi:chromosome segregation ATPase